MKRYFGCSFFLFFTIALFTHCSGECANVQQKLNILVVVGHFPNMAEVFVLNQIVGLIDRGHNVEIFAIGRSIKPVMHDTITKYNLLSKTTYGKITKSALKKYDIILCQFGNLGKQFAEYKRKFNLKAKLVTCFRGYDTSTILKKNKDEYNDLFSVGDLFLPVCEHFRKKLLSVGAPKDKTIVQHSAIDCSLFKFKEREIKKKGTIHIMTASRLVPKKGHVYILRALVPLVKKYRNIQYTIVGSGKLKEKLQQLVTQLGLKPYVHFIDAVPHQELVTILDRADIFVLPSVEDHMGDSEGIPNALKEAMAMGIPVISTYHSGIPELIEHEYNGLLVPEKESQALSNAILYAIEHPDDCKKMAKNARDTVLREYERETQNDRLEDLLLSVYSGEI